MIYFEGETFNDCEEVDKKDEIGEEAINAKYMQGEVRIVTEQGRYPLPTLNTLFSDKKYNMQPEFQRRRRWKDDKKSKLIESFIINVPIPPVFLYEIDFASFEVMDGLQRLSTIIDFYSDKFKLEGLEVWSELNGMTYSELPEKVRDGIDRRYLSSVILLNESAKTREQADFLKKIVFERLNSGGVKLTAQETRNALYDGGLNRLCIMLSNNEDFKILWGINQIEESDLVDVQEETEENKFELYKSMGDVELVLRFFALRFLDQYNTKLEKFLDDFLKRGNKFDKKVLEDYENLFNKTITLANELFGEFAFKQYKKIRTNWDWRDYSRLIYDPMMQVLSCYTRRLKDINKDKMDERIEKLKNFYIDNSDAFNGKKQGKNDIKARIALMDLFISNMLG